MFVNGYHIEYSCSRLYGFRVNVLERFQVAGEVMSCRVVHSELVSIQLNQMDRGVSPQKIREAMEQAEKGAKTWIVNKCYGYMKDV